MNDASHPLWTIIAETVKLAVLSAFYFGMASKPDWSEAIQLLIAFGVFRGPEAVQAFRHRNDE